VDLADVSAWLTSEQSKTNEEYVHRRAVFWRNFVESCRRIYGEPSNWEWHQSQSHDVAYTDGLRPEGWFRSEWISSNYPQNMYRRKMLRHAFFECLTQITLVVAPQRNNLAGVTDRQTVVDSTCYHMIPNMWRLKKRNTWNNTCFSMFLAVFLSSLSLLFFHNSV
jgi:hypothetical protein